MKVKELSGMLIARQMKFGIVISRFNNLFTQQLLRGALDCFERHGASDEYVTVIWVPGALEIPPVVQKLARESSYNALLALGVVIQGATPHAELINTQVARSLTQIGLQEGLPVINGVVSADSIEQAIERSGTKAGNRGADAALSAIEMASLFQKLTKSS